MEAPEKIYCMATEGGFYLTTIKPEPPSIKGVEYIRKDALMDYLHERKEQQDQWVKKCHDMVSQAVSMELEQLINKLESV